MEEKMKEKTGEEKIKEKRGEDREKRREERRQEERRSNTREEKTQDEERELKNVSRPSNPPDALAQNVSKKIPFGRTIPPFFLRKFRI